MEEITENTRKWMENPGSYNLLYSINRVFKKVDFWKAWEGERDFLKKAYKLAERYGLQVHEITDDYVVTSTPRYRCSFLDHILKTEKGKQKDEVIKYLPRIQLLVDDLKQNNLFHGDLAFRNICIDNQDNLHLIDFEQLSRAPDNPIYSMFFDLDSDIKWSSGLVDQIK